MAWSSVRDFADPDSVLWTAAFIVCDLAFESPQLPHGEAGEAGAKQQQHAESPHRAGR